MHSAITSSYRSQGISQHVCQRTAMENFDIRKLSNLCTSRAVGKPYGPQETIEAVLGSNTRSQKQSAKGKM